MAPRRGPGGLMMLALRALFGRLNSDTVDAFESRECWIETGRKRLDVATDGEVTAMDTPLHYRIRPAALRVMVPATVASTDPGD
jgi:diacylglycerol kinase family enzyme